MTATLCPVAVDGPVLAIVDGVFDDPAAVRRAMLALPFTRPAPVNYPGVSATLPAELCPVVGPDRLFRSHFGGLTPFIGEARLTVAADEHQRTSLVHADIAVVTAVVHLSAPQEDGLYFYRHRELDITRVTPDDPWLSFVRRAVVRDSCDLAAWEVTCAVPMRFNRMVVFAGRTFHSGPHRLTGCDARTGRLTQNLFYRWIPQAPTV